MSDFLFEVVTPERKVLQDNVQSVLLPAEGGQLGIWANHAPLVAGLTIGVVEFGPKQGEKRKLAISGGFVEMSENKLTLLANTAELDEEIDVFRAREAKRRAEERLQARQDDWDFSRARIALQKASTRLKAAGQLNK